MAVFSDRENQPFCATAFLRVVAMCAFHDSPTVIAAGDDKVDLFPFVLADIGQPQQARFPVEREPPRVPDSESENLRTATTSGIRIVRRDGIGTVSVDIDAEDLPQPLLRILGSILWVAARAAVSPPDVEKSIRPERDHPAIVVEIGLRHDHENVFGVGRSLQAAALAAILRDDRRPIFAPVVIDEEAPIRLVIRMEGHSQEPLLIAFSPDTIANVEKRCVLKRSAVDDANGSSLLNDEQLTGAVPSVNEKQRQL